MESLASSCAVVVVEPSFLCNACCVVGVTHVNPLIRHTLRPTILYCCSRSAAHVASQCLSDHVPEYRYVAAHFAGSPPQMTASGGGSAVNLLLIRVCKVHNEGLQELYESSVERLAMKGLMASAGNSNDSARDRLYLGGSTAYLRHVLQFGAGASTSGGSGKAAGAGGSRKGGSGEAAGGVPFDPNSPIVLFTDPACAAFTEGDSKGAGSTHNLLMCRAALGRVHTLFGTRPTKESLRERLPELISQLPADCQAGQVRRAHSMNASRREGGGFSNSDLQELCTYCTLYTHTNSYCRTHTHTHTFTHPPPPHPIGELRVRVRLGGLLFHVAALCPAAPPRVLPAVPGEGRRRRRSSGGDREGPWRKRERAGADVGAAS